MSVRPSLEHPSRRNTDDSRLLVYCQNASPSKRVVQSTRENNAPVIFDFDAGPKDAVSNYGSLSNVQVETRVDKFKRRIGYDSRFQKSGRDSDQLRQGSNSKGDLASDKNTVLPPSSTKATSTVSQARQSNSVSPAKQRREIGSLSSFNQRRIGSLAQSNDARPPDGPSES